jgi:hypothetical protein
MPAPIAIVLVIAFVTVEMLTATLLLEPLAGGRLGRRTAFAVGR